VDDALRAALACADDAIAAGEPLRNDLERRVANAGICEALFDRLQDVCTGGRRTADTGAQKSRCCERIRHRVPDKAAGVCERAWRNRVGAIHHHRIEESKACTHVRNVHAQRAVCTHEPRPTPGCAGALPHRRGEAPHKVLHTRCHVRHSVGARQRPVARRFCEPRARQAHPSRPTHELPARLLRFPGQPSDIRDGARGQHGAAAFAETDRAVTITLAEGAQHDRVAVHKKSPRLPVGQRDRVLSARGQLEKRASLLGPSAGQRAGAEKISRPEIAAIDRVVRDELRDGPVRIAIARSIFSMRSYQRTVSLASLQR